MAEKTIPQLQELTEIDENSIFPVDSGIQTYKINAENLAKGVRNLLPNDFSRWDSARSYATNDIVHYNGVFYTSKTNNTGVNPQDDYGTSFFNWKPHRLSTHIDFASGDLTSDSDFIVIREGDVVTITGLISWSTTGNFAESAIGFLPSWARPSLDLSFSSVYSGVNAVIFGISSSGKIGAYPFAGDTFDKFDSILSSFSYTVSPI